MKTLLLSMDMSMTVQKSMFGVFLIRITLLTLLFFAKNIISVIIYLSMLDLHILLIFISAVFTTNKTTMLVNDRKQLCGYLLSVT